jgi:hypothetical protein
LRYIERDNLFRWTVPTVRAAVFPAVAGIHDHSRKRFTRVFNAGSSNRAASGEQRDQCECDDATDETCHSLLIAKTDAASKCFAET